MKIHRVEKWVPKEQGVVLFRDLKNLICQKFRFVLVLCILASCVTGCGGGKTAANITGVRIAQGLNAHKNFQLIYVDWKNTGTTGIYRVTASLTLYDAGGKVIDQVNKFEIYESPNAVAAGTVCSPYDVKPYYYAPQNEQSKAASATAKILRIGKSPTVYMP